MLTILLLALPAQDMARVVDSVREATATPAVSVAVRRADGTLFTYASGTTSDVAFEIGSMTKMFTGALAARLAAAGQLDLDQPVAQWLPDLPGGDRITTRYLLHHTSGLPDLFAEPRFQFGLVAGGSRVWTPAEVLAGAAAPAFAPGSAWAYSSTGFVAAGAVLESVTGMSLPAAWRAEFFEPLGMERTFDGGREAMRPPVAVAPSVSFLSAAGAAGGLLATAGDMAVWMYALGSGQVLDAPAWEAFTTYVDRPDGHRYGLGLLRVELDGRVLIGHRGNTIGSSGAAWYVPSLDLSIVVLTNKPGVLVTPFITAMLRAIEGRATADHPGEG